VYRLLLFFHVQPMNQPTITVWPLAIKRLDTHGLCVNGFKSF
jgi:hypothetical protein